MYVGLYGHLGSGLHTRWFGVGFSSYVCVLWNGGGEYFALGSSESVYHCIFHQPCAKRLTVVIDQGMARVLSSQM